MKLIVTDTNWADEIDVWGFEVIPTDIQYEACRELINFYFNHREEINLYIGTNEDITFTKDYMRHFIVKDVDISKIEVAIELFGSNNRGNCLFDQLVNECLAEISDFPNLNPLESSHIDMLGKIIYGDEED